MPRPTKTRHIGHIPDNKEFYPKQNLGHNRCIELSYEEVEAIRLADYEGLDQLECAELMRVSRGTLQRILKESRRKVAEAIAYGIPITIKGGHYYLEPHRGRCRKGSHGWSETAERASASTDCTSRQLRKRHGRNRQSREIN